MVHLFLLAKQTISPFENLKAKFSNGFLVCLAVEKEYKTNRELYRAHNIIVQPLCLNSSERTGAATASAGAASCAGSSGSENKGA